jgi:hypothetical protein
MSKYESHSIELTTNATFEAPNLEPSEEIQSKRICQESELAEDLIIAMMNEEKRNER